MSTWTEYTRFAIALFAILTPFADIPIYLGLTEGRSERYKKRTADAAVLTVLCVLATTAVAGDLLLRLFGTSLDSFRVGGGIVLLLMALSMLSAEVSRVQQTPGEKDDAEQSDSVGVVPLGIPLLAGPGSISTVIIESQRHDSLGHLAIILGAIAFDCLLLWVSFRLAAPIGAKLGKTGLNILNRLFGLILAAIAVEILATGLRHLFPGLTGTG